MNHLMVFINFACLLAGLICLSNSWSSYRKSLHIQRRRQLHFFAAYSFLIIGAILFAYAHTNLGAGWFVQTLFASFVFWGIAALEASFAALVLPTPDFPTQVLRTWIFRGCIGLSGLQGILIWFAHSDLTQLICILAAILPLFLMVAWCLATKVRHQPPVKPVVDKPKTVANRIFVALYLSLSILAAAEIHYLVTQPPSAGFISLALPLGYLIATIQFWQANAKPVRTPVPTPHFHLPPQLIDSQGISPREKEIANLILLGLGNKEIAARLILSENTVRNHIYSLYQKLHIQKRMDLLALTSQTEHWGPIKIS